MDIYFFFKAYPLFNPKFRKTFGLMGSLSVLLISLVPIIIFIFWLERYPEEVSIFVSSAGIKYVILILALISGLFGSIAGLILVYTYSLLLAFRRRIVSVLICEILGVPLGLLVSHISLELQNSLSGQITVALDYLLIWLTFMGGCMSLVLVYYSWNKVLEAQPVAGGDATRCRS